ncbi:fungal fucose-specific lectin protein [Diplodia corticola]|uniref:Fungal fucose-specific lectin protein n=1 Tax=Diplodia corticola TaxID=236234 RepID=A0A1J9QJ73_9PEZI|nr:fungal fucose-specific lectin protein [Diplodia corticola]OJD28910.1 fungal fucose-specific lectin protein [Diplodia corticola]
MDRSDYEYSTLEVDDTQCLTQIKSNTRHDVPETQPGNSLPEAFPSDAPEVIDGREGARPRRSMLCGLRRKTFWVALATGVTLIAISIAVGIGVGVTSQKNSNSSSTAPPSPSPSPSGNVASFSRLAAANYTDRQKAEHTLVYYQDDALNLWMADLDLTKNAWTQSQVNTTGYKPKNGTPIAAINIKIQARVDLHIRFVSETNYIRALFLDRLNNRDWRIAHKPDSVWSVTDESNLGDYYAQCDGCDSTGFMIFQSDHTHKTAFAYPYNDFSFNNSIPDGIVPDLGTAYALAPIQAIEELGDTHGYAGIYLSVDQALREFYFATGHGVKVTNVNLTMTVDAGAQIAAMSYAQNGLRYVQVLVTRETGGVQMAYLDGGPAQDWTWTDVVGGMEEVVPLSPISATPVGRVYALEEGENGRRRIVEFNRTSSTGIPKFERLGPINITAVST